MDINKRTVLLKSSAKEGEYPACTIEDIISLLEEITRPEGRVLNHADPTECYVLFPPMVQLDDVYNLNKDPSWVRGSMAYTIRQPPSIIVNIIKKLVEKKPLKEGEKYELLPIEPERGRGSEGPQLHSTPKRKAEPVASFLTEQRKQLETQELQKVLSIVQTELRHRQDASFSPVQEVSSILQTLLKDGALRTNIPMLSTFSGERAKGEFSFEQWSYELQSLRKTYSDSALREGIQHSLRGAAADTVRNMGPDVPLDTILKKFTIVFGNVKSFDLLMRDFYPADQGEEESIPSFVTRMEGLLSQIRDKYSEKFTQPEEQRLVKDRLFHGCRKSIRDSVKYCFADPHMDYMQFLEECRKVEDEDKVGQVKGNPSKAKVAAATVPPTREDELTKQLRYQQYQIDTLVGQIKHLVSAVKATRSSSRGATTGGARMPTHTTWRGGSRGRGPLRTTPQPRATDSQLTLGAGSTCKCWQCGELEHIKREWPTLKESGLFKKGNASTALYVWRVIPQLTSLT